MKRYDMNNACDGESGECRAEMVPTVYGDYYLVSEVEPIIAERDALRLRAEKAEAEREEMRAMLIEVDSALRDAWNKGNLPSRVIPGELARRVFAVAKRKEDTP